MRAPVADHAPGAEPGVNPMSNVTFPIRRLAPSLFALALVACSGGGSGERVNPIPPIPPTSAEAGKWSDVIDWPMIPIHAALLPDGRVFTFGTDDGSPAGQAVPTGKFFYDLWNPTPAVDEDPHLRLPNFTLVDTFCAAQILLPQIDGGVLVVGGDTFPRPLEGPDPDDEQDVPEPFDDGNENTTILDYTVDVEALRRGEDPAEEQSLSRGADMSAGRWYASVTTLLNGDTYIQGGNSRTRISGELFPEIRRTNGTILRLGIDTSDLRYYYPRNFVAPDGRIFGYDTEGQMYYVDTNAGTLTLAGTLDEDYTGDDSSVAMFAPGRLLNTGGESARVAVIDIRSGAPVVTETQILSSHRRLATATIMANGEVLVTGGSPVYNTLPGVSYYAERWNPVTGQWTRGAQGVIPRLYHSMSLLLQDGRVLVGGGGAPGPAENLNAEIYSPPYLFEANGAPRSRPQLSSVPTTATVGREFSLRYSDINSPAARVVLVKSGAVTHGFNFDQRFVQLPFIRRDCPGGQCLDVRMPSAASDVPPGYYLLFVLNERGTPSLGKFVFVGVAGAVDPAQDPTVVGPADRTGTVGALVSFPVSGSDPNAGTTLRYAAAGLPAGLGINASNGIVSGTPTTAGSYDTVVSVSDGVRTASANFVWTIAAAAAP